MSKARINYGLSILNQMMIEQVIDHIQKSFESNDVGARKTIRLLTDVRNNDKLDKIMMGWASYLVTNGFLYRDADEGVILDILKAVIEINKNLNEGRSPVVTQKKGSYPDINF